MPAAVIFAPRFAPLLTELRGSLGGAALFKASEVPALGQSLVAAMADAGTDVAPCAIDDVHQSFAPFFTSTGCHTNLLATLYAGCTLAVEPEFHVVRSL